MEHSRLKSGLKIAAIFALAFLAIASFSQKVSAASTSPATDEITSQLISAQANHTINFKTPSGIDAPTDTITINLSAFTFGTVGVGDIDIFHGPVSGLEVPDAHAALPGIGVWGIGLGGGTVTLTPPTDSAPGQVLPNDFITVRIGTNAVGGVNRLTNPALAGAVLINIGGGFGDSGHIATDIVNDDGVNIMATVSGTPTITYISPNQVTQGTPGFTLTVHGTGFQPTSVVRLDGSDRVTTYVSSTVITAQITAPDITDPANRAVTVWNPSPGLLSNPANLAITPPQGGGGQNPPLIFNVHVINITQSSARIVWDTDKLADSRVDYGLTIAHGLSVSNGSFVFSHGLDLNGLLPNTTYHFTVTSQDQFNNLSTSVDYTFTTLAVQQLIISNVTSTSIADTSAVIVWDTNHTATSKVEYGTSPALGFWMIVPGDVVNHAVPLTGLLADIQYYYRVISADSFGLSATSSIFTFKTQADHTPPSNVPLTATPGDTNVLLIWSHPPEPDFAGVRIMRRTGGYPTSPTDGTLVYDGLATTFLDTGLTNGLTYYYAAYTYDTHSNFSSGSLASATPVGPPIIPPTPTTTPPIPPPPPVPPVPPVPPISPIPPTPTTTPPVPGQIQIHALYYSANGTVLLQPDQNGNFGVLAGSSVYVYVPTANLGSTPQFGVMTVGGQAYSLTLNADGTAYTGTFLAPSSNTFQVDIRISFQNGQLGTVQDHFVVQPGGQVVEEQLPAGPPIVVPGAQVALYQNVNGNWIPWNATPYGQSNPIISDQNGAFVFVVPNGEYYAIISKEGYVGVRTPTQMVSNNVFGGLVPLIKLPQPITPTTTFPFIQNVPQQIQYLALVGQSIIQRPEVITAVNDYVAPTLLAIAIINTAAALPLFSLLAYLQFFFTQPFLLFGRRKRKRWGIIYNSLSKQPVEFAVVRLIHYESRLIVQTRVTDKNGRYVFYPKPGNYLLEISKPGFAFPTQYLADQKVDGDYTDLYHGEMIALEDSDPIALNVPMDPVKVVETPRRVLYNYFIRSFQHIISLLGVIISLVSLIISPTWILALLFLAQVAFYLLFRRLAMPAKAKPWGLVYDTSTRKPVQGAVVRIFDRKFNKLLETLITDSKGRYGFFADKNNFYVTVEKTNYQKFTSLDIDLVKTRKETIVDLNIGLKLQPKK
ncbi:MAG: hypothetical protein PHC53_03280 [Patescibacteria group bacterium]|nr:hypothetical protein [Patescibacteria group bacterium]